MLPETRPGWFSSTVWRVRGTVVIWANRPIGVLFCRAPPRPAHNMSGFWMRQIPTIRCFTSRFSLEAHLLHSSSKCAARGNIKRQGWQPPCLLRCCLFFHFTALAHRLLQPQHIQLDRLELSNLNDEQECHSPADYATSLPTKLPKASLPGRLRRRTTG